MLAAPMLLLAPWSLTLLGSPKQFLTEAGLDYGAGAATPVDLLTLSPGGPGATNGLFLVGLVAAGLAALLRAGRQLAVRAAWITALAGLLFAGLSNGSAWAGPATLVYGLALLSAAVVGAEGAKERVATQSFGWRQPLAALVAAAAVAAPLLAAVGWMAGGADGPLSRRDPVQVPAFVAEESGTEDQARTLVLDGGAGASGVSYTLVRGSGARLGDADLAAADGNDQRLDGIVSHLVAGSGADQTSQLGGYAVRYVLLRDGASHRMSRVLDATPGLTRLSQADGSALWRVDQQVSRVSIVPGKAGNGAVGAVTAPVPVAAGPVESHATLPSGPAGRILRLADTADSGWQATLDGSPLKSVTVDDWAQGFELPASGGKLELTYDTPLTHTLWAWTQGFLLLVVLVLALPGRRRDVDDDLPEEEPVSEQPVTGEGRRARRLRAAAAAEAQEGTQGPEGADAVHPDGGEGTEHPDAGTPPPPPTVPGQPHYDPGYADPYEQQQPYVPQQTPYGGAPYEQQSYDPSGYDQASGYDPSAGYGQASGYDQVPGYGQQPYPGSYEQPYEQRPYQGAYEQPYGQPYEQGAQGEHDRVPYEEWQAQQYADPQAPRAAPAAEPYGYPQDGYDGTRGYDNRYGNGSEQQ